MAVIDSIWLHWPETKALAEAFGEDELRFVGGCVRDALLGREVSDVDAATTLKPEQVMQRLTDKGMKVIPTGIDHGTVTVVAGKRHFEITTLRRDVSTDGRHATVAYTQSWQEDASRRDFTMNALYCTDKGEVFDYFGGVEDARSGQVRFIGDAGERIAEDGLRILRFFRFFAHYGHDPIDAQGLAACAAQSEHIKKLSGERICAEMLKLLTSERAALVVGVMQRNEIWHHVVPHVVNPESLARLPGILHKARRGSDAILALALLLRSVPREVADLVEQVAKRWKLSKAQYKRLTQLCAGADWPVAEGKWQLTPDDRIWKRQIRSAGKALFCDRVLLCMAEGAEETAGLKALALAQAWEIPVFPLSGEDLQAAGIAPGKAMGMLLKTLEAYWEWQGYVADKKALLNYAAQKNIFK